MDEPARPAADTVSDASDSDLGGKPASRSNLLTLETLQQHNAVKKSF
jgi:hypothetical protein